MAALTTTTYDYALKTLWKQKQLADTTLKDHPLLAMLRKDTSFGGANLVLATRYADSAGRSATFATAQTNKSASPGVKFTLTRVKDYALGSIENEVLLASESDPMALAKAFDTELGSSMNAATRSLAGACYRTSTGSIGQISAGSTVGSATITLSNINDITNFDKGMVVTLHATDGAAARTGTNTITGIDRDLGTLTTTTAWTTGISAAAASDYICQQGDVNLKLSGLAAWIPSTAPSATTFFGVDRTADVTRLGGKRIDISALAPEEGLVTALLSLGREGASPDYVFMNYVDYKNVQLSLGSKVQYVDVTQGNIGFKGIKVDGPKGFVTVLPDQDCPSGLGYMLQMDTWALYSLGEAPRLLSTDGNKILREASADAVEFRLGYYAQLGCEAPGYNAVLTLPS